MTVEHLRRKSIEEKLKMLTMTKNDQGVEHLVKSRSTFFTARHSLILELGWKQRLEVAGKGHDRVAQ